MVLPNNFSTWEHFQNIWRQTHNRNVRQFFSDVGDENWDADITTPRGSLRVACTFDDNDTIIQSLARWFFFHGDVRGWEEFIEPSYGIPIGSYHETRKFKPQIRLYFKEDNNDIEEGYRPLTGEITLRIMLDKEQTITKIELTTIANKIKANFTKNNGYRWHKGKILCSYNDPDKGYKLQLLCFTKQDAKDLIKEVLDIQNHTPDWEKLTINENEQPGAAYPTIPPKKTILGEQVKQPRKRPSGHVRFQWATCSIWGLTRPVCLVDRVYRFLDPLVEV